MRIPNHAVLNETVEATDDLKKGWSKGLLLPQVPVEWKWDAEEFLANCCIKAGLSPDTWLMRGTKIFKFSCIIAKELSANGEIKIVNMYKGDKYEK